MMLPTVIRGFRLAYGSWKIICISRRIFLKSPPRSVVRLLLRKFTEPPVGLYSCRMARPAVLLPQPDSPTSPSVSPRFTKKSMPSTARTAPTVRRKTPPPRRGKVHLQAFCAERYAAHFALILARHYCGRLAGGGLTRVRADVRLA